MTIIGKKLNLVASTLVCLDIKEEMNQSISDGESYSRTHNLKNKENTLMSWQSEWREL